MSVDEIIIIGDWLRVKCEGQSELLPLSFFTLTMISTNRALLFGGKTRTEVQRGEGDDTGRAADECSNRVYLIECHTSRGSSHSQVSFYARSTRDLV